jgi:hypothetical protein
MKFKSRTNIILRALISTGTVIYVGCYPMVRLGAASFPCPNSAVSKPTISFIRPDDKKVGVTSTQAVADGYDVIAIGPILGNLDSIPIAATTSCTKSTISFQMLIMRHGSYDDPAYNLPDIAMGPVTVFQPKAQIHITPWQSKIAIHVSWNIKMPDGKLVFGLAKTYNDQPLNYPIKADLFLNLEDKR